MTQQIPTYWWRARPNFGDGLSPLLLQHFAGIEPIYADPKDAILCSTGSVLDVIPKGWQGMVLGSGKLHERTQLNLSNALILAMRGPLSAMGMDSGGRHGFLRGDYALGDPGLLVDMLVNRYHNTDTGDRRQLGIIPHWTDKDDALWNQFRGFSRDAKKINSKSNPMDAILEIAQCEKIVSSSLHGIIIADALGIPRRAELFPGARSLPYEGGDFKYRDYGAAIMQPIVFGKVQTPHRWRIEELQTGLFDAFAEAGKILKDYPWGTEEK